MTAGGNRKGAGRPSTGRRPVSFYITAVEEVVLRDKLTEIRPVVTGGIKPPKYKKYTCNCPGKVIKSVTPVEALCSECETQFKPLKKVISKTPIIADKSLNLNGEFTPKGNGTARLIKK